MLSSTHRGVCWASLLLAAGFGVSCNDSTGPGSGGGAPASVSPLAGHDQTGAAGAALPDSLVVVVRDAGGNARGGVFVRWEVTEGGGSVSPANTTTDAAGTARTRWTLGSTAGPNTVTAVVTGLAPVTFGADGRPGAASVVMAIAGDDQDGSVGAPVPDSLVVEVRDAHGNAVPGANVSWEVLEGGGTVEAEAAATGAAGRVRAAWTLGTAVGPNRVRAAVGEIVSAEFTASARAGSPGSVVVVSGTGQEDLVGRTLAEPMVVEVMDEHGNRVAGTEVVWSIAAGSGTVSPVATTTDSAGRASTTLTLGNSVGPVTVTATAGSLISAPIGAEAVGIQSIAISPDVDVLIVGGSVVLSAEVRDSKGRTVTESVTWSSSDTTRLRVDAQGRAVATGAGAAEIRATVHGVTEGVTIRGIVLGGIAAGSQHSCAISTSGEIYCWGSGEWGQLGNGKDGTSQTRYLETRPVKASGSYAGSAVLAALGSTCAHRPDGTLVCWGRGADGELGTGASGPQYRTLTPVTAAGGMSFERAEATASRRICGITGGGGTYCWGAEFIGNGTTGSSASPAAVAGSFRAVSPGGFHTCALTTGNLASCWGHDAEWSAGNTGNHLAPVAIGGSKQFTSLASGGRHVCALDADGAMYCWGEGQAGQLGTGKHGVIDGTPYRETEPVAVSTSLRFLSVHASLFATCGLAKDRTVWCWGSSALIGTSVVSTPRQVSSSLRFREISLGGNHACGLDLEGAAYCWGENDHGALGRGNTVTSTSPVRVLGPRTPEN
jgi:alpha-tubulin suppressor-like RCC1 family protein